MGKAILVMDMPECCEECPLMRCEVDCIPEEYCKANNNEEIINVEKKTDWCPLKELPERKEEVRYCGNGIFGINDMSKSRFNEGWNDCLDEILKERD